jgi:hypothetical protein
MAEGYPTDLSSLPAGKICKQCKRIFPATKDYFYAREQAKSDKNPLGLNPRCYKCWSEHNSEYLKKRKALGILVPYQAQRSSQEKIEAHRGALIRHNRFVKLQCLQAYSDNIPFCECCKEARFEFLTIDHTDNNGAAHRRSIGRKSMYVWLRQRGFPPGYRVLCINCNFSIGAYGYCPHQSPGVDISTIKPRYRRTKYWDSIKDLQKETYKPKPQ